MYVCIHIPYPVGFFPSVQPRHAEGQGEGRLCPALAELRQQRKQCEDAGGAAAGEEHQQKHRDVALGPEVILIEQMGYS